jgi:hypothetical protein
MDKVGDLDRVRSAIATCYRRGALKLPRAHVEGELDLSTVPLLSPTHW